MPLSSGLHVRPRARWTAILSALAWLAVRVTTAHARPLPPAEEAALARADSLTRAGQRISSARVLDSLETLSGSNPRLQSAVGLGRVRASLSVSRVDEADSLLGPLLSRFRIDRDTLLWVRGLRLDAWLERQRHRPEAGARAFRAAIRMAHRARLPIEEAQAEMDAALGAIESGRSAEARDGYRRALEALERGGNERVRMRARAGLARALTELGSLDDARREHVAVLEVAVRLGDLAQQIETNHNLGALEHMHGDISKAEAYYLEALRLKRATGRRQSELVTARALAILRINAGRNSEADSILSATLPIALGPGVGQEERARMLSQVGVLRRRQGRLEEAIAYGHRALAAADSVSAIAAVSVCLPLVATLELAGRPSEAALVVDHELKRHDLDLTPEVRAKLLGERGILARQMGRPLEAIGPLRTALAADSSRRQGSFAYGRLELMSELARCYTAVGRLDSAIAWYRVTADTWETWRRDSRDPTWRERYDDAGQRFAGEFGAVLIDPRRGGTATARATEAFAELQRFRARTLAERIHDPTRRPAPSIRPVDVAGLRRGLRGGELFLDVHATPETTLVIAVTQDSVAAWGAVRSSALTTRLARLRDLLSEPEQGSSTVREQAAAALGRDLFGPGAGMIDAATAVLLSAGSLAQYPLGMLPVSGRSAPMALAHETSLVPSATLLAGSRARAGGVKTWDTPLIAIARTRDGAGHTLRGAGDEARWLARRYVGAEARVDDDRLSQATIATLAARTQVLHFAAHARDDPSRPWHTGLLLGRPGAANAWLEAGQVAVMRPAARLVVLAGCGTVGGVGDVSETLEGLSTAWLAAGVPATLASQWEVDDASSALLMRRFYEALASGQTVGASLRDAQGQIHGHSETSSPYYWAGFVIIGDPVTRVRLRHR